MQRTRIAWRLVAGVAVSITAAPPGGTWWGSAGAPLRAEIAITGDDWSRHVKLAAEPGNTAPAVATTADGKKSLHLPRPSGDKFAIYLIKVTQLPAGKTRFPVRVVARQVQDSANGLAVRNLTIDPDDPESDPTQQVQASFVAILLSDSAGTGPRARDDRDLAADVDPPGTLGGLSGARVEDPALSTALHPAGQLTTANATLELKPGLNVLRLDPTDLRRLPAYDPDSGTQLFSLVIGPGEAGLQGAVLGGILIRGEDWEEHGSLGAQAGVTPPAVVTTVDGHRSLHMPRPSGDKYGIYTVRVAQLPAGKTRFPVKVLAREVRDSTNGLGIRNLTIDPDDPNSDRSQQVQQSYLSILLSDGAGGVCPRAEDDLGNDDRPSTGAGCAGPIGLSGTIVQDPALSPLLHPAGEITTSSATLELRPGLNVLRLDTTDPRDLPIYDPNSGYQLFLLGIGPDEVELKGEAVQPCSVSRQFSPNPYFPGDLVAVKLTGRDLVGETRVTDAFPAGWTVVDAGGGVVAGNTIAFTALADGDLTYRLRAPGPCANVTFDGVTSGPLCRGEVTSLSRRLRCGIQFSGGISGMLILGPIDLGDAGVDCDDQGRLAVTDYLRIGATGERNVLAAYGYEIKPGFGTTAGGLGVKEAPNPAINPRRAEGILTAWRADADAEGRINFQDPDNLGPLDHYLLYALVYLDNTTGACLDAVLEVASDDAAKVLLNGDLVHLASGCRGALAEAGAGEQIPVVLAAGRNVLVIAVVEGTGGSGFRLMVRHPDGSPLTDGTVAVEFTPPARYPVAPQASVARSIRPKVARPGDRVSVALVASNAAGQTTTVEDVFPAGWTVADAGGGVVAGNTIAFTRTGDGSSTYVLTVPAAFTGAAEFSGKLEAAGAAGCEAVGGEPSLQVVASDLGCLPDPIASPADLVRAFLFGSRLLDCPTFNDPAVSYTIVHHAANDAAAASALAYQAARGWGYEVLYPDPAASPFGARFGFGAFGPFDDTRNDRDKFPDRCPEEVYDSAIGMKSFPQACNLAGVGNTADPCTASTVLPGGARYTPVGGIFRADVPNGRYRFVAAVGDADNPHSHRLLAEDGGSGPPSAIGADHVVLVRSFDQSQYALGETDPIERGEGVFARVGFDCRIPPPGDGAAPSPVFVNMDRDGRPTSGPPESPELVVTRGYIRIHQLQGNSNVGPGSSDPDPNGADLVVLELWRTGPVSCPGEGDTHCADLAVTGPEGNAPGKYTASAAAIDDVKDNEGEALRYTFRAQKGAAPPLVVGPQAASTAVFDLTPGTWTVSVTVDDDPGCEDRAGDATCSRQVAVQGSGGGILPGDCNGDGRLDISDGICLLLYLFLGSSQPLPCGDGTLAGAGNASLLNFNGDPAVDLSDAIAALSFLFITGAPHVLGEVCRSIEGCPAVCVSQD